MMLWVFSWVLLERAQGFLEILPGIVGLTFLAVMYIVGLWTLDIECQ